MLSFYFFLLASLCFLAVVVELIHGKQVGAQEGSPVLPLSFVAFRNNYLFIYSLAMGKNSLA